MKFYLHEIVERSLPKSTVTANFFWPRSAPFTAPNRRDPVYLPRLSITVVLLSDRDVPHQRLTFGRSILVNEATAAAKPLEKTNPPWRPAEESNGIVCGSQGIFGRMKPGSQPELQNRPNLRAPNEPNAPATKRSHRAHSVLRAITNHTGISAASLPGRSKKRTHFRVGAKKAKALCNSETTGGRTNSTSGGVGFADYKTKPIPAGTQCQTNPPRPRHSGFLDSLPHFSGFRSFRFSRPRIFSSIGVPLNPKRLLNWFTRYRSCEKCRGPALSVNKTKDGGRTPVCVM